ncbi:hypothetical protein ACFLXI_10415 [Chloroflexota bacterium]
MQKKRLLVSSLVLVFIAAVMAGVYLYFRLQQVSTNSINIDIPGTGNNAAQPGAGIQPSLEQILAQGSPLGAQVAKPAGHIEGHPQIQEIKLVGTLAEVPYADEDGFLVFPLTISNSEAYPASVLLRQLPYGTDQMLPLVVAQRSVEGDGVRLKREFSNQHLYAVQAHYAGKIGSKFVAELGTGIGTQAVKDYFTDKVDASGYSNRVSSRYRTNYS